MRRCLLALCLALPLLAWSQDVQMQANVVRADASADSSAPKVTPAEIKRNQQRARELLTTAESEARALDAPMRALTLMQIANALSAMDTARAAAVMHDAFVATTEMDPAKASDKRLLQDRIFEGLLALAPDSVPELLPQAEPASRTRALGRLVQRAMQKKDYARAIELVNQAAAEPGPFPYDAVSSLMMGLPPENNGDRLNAFTQALTAYQRDQSNIIMSSGFDRLIVRFGATLPKGLVLDAVDEVLKRAKESDQQANFTLASAAGSASFNSSYDYYLFELLPVIRHWDPSRADDMLKQNTQLQPVMQQYPNGVQSLDPTIRDTPPKPGENSGMRMSVSSSGPGGSGSSTNRNGPLPSSNASAQQVRAQYDAEVARIEQDAAKNPRPAIARALALPDPVANAHPRIDALEGIARACWKDQPAAARDALGELVKLVANLKPEEQRPYLVNAADLYAKAGDNEAAKKTIAAGIKVAEALYEADKNPDSPNEALKGYWPSTSAWSQFVMLAQRIAPDLAQEIMGGIKDEEVRTTVHVAYAMALAGGRSPANTVMITRGNSTSMMSFSGPQ